MKRSPLAKFSKKPRPLVRIMSDGREIIEPGPKGNAERKRRRRIVWERDGGVCILCSHWMPFEASTIEHKIIKSGGQHDDRIENLAVSHPFGNTSRGSMKLELYLQKPLEDRIRRCHGL